MAKLSIFSSVHAPTLIFGHEYQIMNGIEDHELMQAKTLDSCKELAI